jgi:hypothetical protein
MSKRVIMRSMYEDDGCEGNTRNKVKQTRGGRQIKLRSRLKTARMSAACLGISMSSAHD